MKRNILTLLIPLMSVLAISCGKDEPTKQEEKITLSFSIVGADVIETDEPFTSTKSDNGNETTYAIGVWEYNANTSQYDEYAHGSFDSSQNITIQVTKDKKYKFKVALFKDFFSSGERLVVETSDTHTHLTTAENMFTYGEGMFRQLKENVKTQAFIANGTGSKAIFPGETFYGEINDLTISQGTNISVNLSRVSTYVEIKVNGMSSGKVESTTPALKFSIEYPNTTYATWITDSSYREGADSFNQPIKLQYVDSQSNVTTLVDQNFTFKRNYKKTITINLTSSSSSEFNSTFSISVSGSSLQIDEGQTFDVNI